MDASSSSKRAIQEEFFKNFFKQVIPPQESKALDANVKLPMKPQYYLNKIKLYGYAIVEDLLSPEECDKMARSALRLAKSFDKKDKQVFAPEKECQLETDYLIHSNDKVMPFYESKALDKDGNILANPQYSLNKIAHALHYVHPLFRRYTYSGRVQSLARRLRLQEPAVVQSMVIFKNPGVSSEAQPHQLSTYLYTEPKPIFGFCIALEDATVDNGCLYIAAGSHKTGNHRRLIRNPDPTATNKLIYNKPAPTYSTLTFKPIPIKKGSCLILHGDVVHRSGINKTDKPRLAYAFNVVEKINNTFLPDNWLQEGPAAPFESLYTAGPYTKESRPSISESGPSTSDPGPSTRESGPSTSESGPSTSGSVPFTSDSVPSTSKSGPSTSE